MTTATAQTDRFASEAPQAQRSSYAQSLSSTASLGGAAVVSVLLGIVRTKCVAVLLGPSGVGLVGAYTAITNLAGTIAGLGVQSSGVRQIAEAAGQHEAGRVAVVALALRRVTRLLGILGAALMVVCAPLLSQWTFGNSEHTVALMVLAATVLMGCVSGGQMALLQGLRRVGDLIRVKLIGALLGTAIGIPMIYLWGMQAVVPLLTAVAAAAVISSWWYARRVSIAPTGLSWGDCCRECLPLLRLGLALMASGLMTLVVAYLLRVIIMRRLGLEAAGQYQAAANLASVYVGFVLSAMGTDFYPRLTAAAQDHRTMVRMLNEQAEIALLLATPGILLTIALAPAVVLIFYSGGFDAAVAILRWQVLGVALRVISWPLGFAVLARGRASLFFWTELAANLVHVAGIWFGLQWFGLAGAGMAYLLLYAFYWLLMFLVVRRMLGFAYTPALRRALALALTATIAVAATAWLVPARWATAAGLLLGAGAAWYSMNALASLAPDLRALAMWRRASGRAARMLPWRHG